MIVSVAIRMSIVALVATLVSGCGASASPSDPVSFVPAPTTITTPSPQPSIGPSASTAQAAPASPTAEPTAPPAEPEPLAERPTFDVGLMMVTVADRVRVRSSPSTGPESAKYEPVLPLDTVLHALEGPVSGAGYWWYRVELMDPSQHLIGGIREGWVAMTDHSLIR